MRNDQSLGDAAVECLRTFVRRAANNVARARRGDAKGVHDLRVAIRKIRGVLCILRETGLVEREVDAEERELARLFRALGKVRDQDVASARANVLAPRPRNDKALEKGRRRARKKVRALMRDRDPRRVLARLERRLRRALADQRGPLVRHVAGSVVLRRFEVVLEFASVVPGPMAVMHRLRVAVKDLRDALGVFGAVLGSPAARIDRLLQHAQDDLGALHDDEVARLLVGDESNRRGRSVASFMQSWTAIAGGALAKTLSRMIERLLIVEAHSTRR